MKEFIENILLSKPVLTGLKRELIRLIIILFAYFIGRYSMRYYLGKSLAWDYEASGILIGILVIWFISLVQTVNAGYKEYINK